MLLEELARRLREAGVEVEVEGDARVEIRALEVDSRRVGPGCLFVAQEGAAVDSHRFVPAAVAQGAAAVVVARSWGEAAGAPALLVGSPGRALGHLAAAFYGDPGRSLEIVGLTGTNGKTTTTFLLESIARAAGRNPGVIGTINQRFAGQVYTSPNTTPGALELHRLLRQMVDAGVDTVLMEVSSHALVTGRVVGVPFALGAFLNLSQDHLDFHGSMEAYLEAKARLFSEVLPWSAAALGRAPVGLVHLGDPAGAAVWDRVGEGVRKASFDGRAAPGAADFAAQGASLRAEGTEFVLVRPDGEGLRVRSGLLGALNLENLVAACGVALSLGWPAEAVVEGIAALEGVPGRLQRVVAPGPGRPAVVVDYAHSPRAVEVAAESLRALTRGRLITVLGCGGDRDQDKRPRMGLAAAQRSDLVVVTSDNPRSEDPAAIAAAVRRGALSAPGAAEWSEGWRRWRALEDSGDLRNAAAGPLVLEELSRRRAIALAVSLAGEGDLVLIAGKGHEETQEVSGRRWPLSDVAEARLALASASGRAASRLFSAAELGAMCGAAVEGEAPLAWQGHNGGIVTDSRAVVEGAVFVALRGERFDGHAFLGAAVERGAQALVVEGEEGAAQARAAWSRGGRAGLTLVVGETLWALGEMARGVLGWLRAARPWQQSVALTGSNGKTTTKELIAALLVDWVGLEEGRVYRTPGNWNNLVGVPLSAFEVPLGADAVVLEHGANARGEVARLVEISGAKVRVLTSISEAHLGGFGSRAGILAAKGEIFGGPVRAEASVLPRAVAQELPEGLPAGRVWWGLGEQSESEISSRFGRLTPSVTGFVAWGWLEGEGDKARARVSLREVDRGAGEGRMAVDVGYELLGSHNAANLSLAVAAVLELGRGLGWSPAGREAVELRSLRAPSGRLTRVWLEGALSGVLLLNDAYNANPGSMGAGLEVLVSEARRRGGAAVAVLGEMYELGEEAAALHREVGRRAAALGVEGVLAFGPLSVSLAAGAREGAAGWVESIPALEDEAALEAAALLRGRLKGGDVVLVKGSRGARMERIVAALLSAPVGEG